MGLGHNRDLGLNYNYFCGVSHTPPHPQNEFLEGG